MGAILRVALLENTHRLPLADGIFSIWVGAADVAVIKVDGTSVGVS